MLRSYKVSNNSFASKLIRALPVILLAVICVFVIYAAAANRLPFLDILNENESETSGSQTSVSQSDTSSDVSADISDEESTDSSVTAAAALAKFDREYTDKYVLTDLCYNSSTMELVLVAHIDALADTQTLLARMGFIFRTDADGTVTLLDELYDVIFDTMPDGYKFAGLRDEFDNPLFTYDGDYYYLDKSTANFLKTLYEDARNTRGVVFDYPSYYGRYQDDVIVRKKVSGGWGLYDTNKESYTVYPNKEYVFTFNGNYLACVLERKSERLRFYNKNGNSITQEYYQPLTNGLESLGYYHFVHGMTRVRRVYKLNGEQVSEECLMYTDKSLFILPADFKLITYGDGILQLEKDGRYGYMSWTGAWITDPVFTASQPFIEGFAVVGINGKYGIIDTLGNYVVQPVFDSITNCSGGVIILYDAKTGYYILNKTTLGTGVDIDIS